MNDTIHIPIKYRTIIYMIKKNKQQFVQMQANAFRHFKIYDLDNLDILNYVNIKLFIFRQIILTLIFKYIYRERGTESSLEIFFSWKKSFIILTL